MNIDYLIVGSGLTGATIARALQDAGRSVLVIDRRSHMGGNVHDHSHPSGILIHTYGPHYFRTNDEDLWSYVNRFSNFYSYEPQSPKTSSTMTKKTRKWTSPWTK